MLFLNKNRTKSGTADAVLIANYKKYDDSSYLGKLFEKYSHAVYLTCLKYLEDEEDSKDAVMAIFAKIAEDLKTHKVSNFKSWLYSVTKNHCLMLLREPSRHKNISATPSEMEELVQTADSELTIVSGMDEKMLIEQLKLALQQLDEAQGKCIQLFYFEENSYKEIAKLTKFEIKQVKSYIQNGKRNLRNILQQQMVAKRGE